MAEQSWDPNNYAHHARFVADLGMPVVELLAPRPGERVLDLGCGDGALTVKLVELGCEVVGVDASAPQIEAARALGLEAYTVDGHELAYASEFDAVFSNAALHWMKRDPDRVIANVYRALKPGGRFCAEMGGAHCVETIYQGLASCLARRGIDAAALNPWFFPAPEDYGARLERAGFRIAEIKHFPRLTPLPTDIAGWLGTFAQVFLGAVPEAKRPGFIAEVVEELRPALCDAAGSWTADYTRLRFLAHKPE
ncbi:MAG: class I SAM-dependent methyltransferase [Dehalococcoidia bacterium]